MAPKTVAIIGARLNSSRLPRKHLLDLAGAPVIAHIVRRLETIEALDEIVIATTADAFNNDLLEVAGSIGVPGFAFEGNVNDLMGRVDSVVQTTNADIILYVCGDSPLIDPSVMAAWIDAFKTNKQFDTAAHKSAETVHGGYDIFSRRFWDKLIAASKTPSEREHVGSVYRHSHKVEPRAIYSREEEPLFSSLSHRFSVDTPHDYLFMHRVYKDWYAENPSDSIVDLTWVLEQLQENPGLKRINGRVHQRGVDEIPPRIKIVAETGKGIGLGHLSRALVIALSLQENLAARIELILIGERADHSLLRLLPHRWVGPTLDDAEVLDLENTDFLIADVKTTPTLLREIDRQDCRFIGIDRALAEDAPYDFHWMPSLYLDADLIATLGERLLYGADCFLLKPDYLLDTPEQTEDDRSQILVLTGGADPAGLNKTLPQELSEYLGSTVHLTWVEGPFAQRVVAPTGAEDQFTILHKPINLPDIMPTFDAALCVFGVTFFECLQAGLPVVAVDVLGAATKGEWLYLKSLFPTLIASDMADAKEKLAALINKEVSVDLTEIGETLRKGPGNFAAFIKSLHDGEAK